MEVKEKIKLKFVNAFKELFNKYWRYIIFYGGRNSGKSYHVAASLLLRGRDNKLRILCVREIQNTISDSVHKLLRDIIDTYEMTDYVVTEKSITNRLSGTEFIFKGLSHNINEVKSTEGVDICWIEEAQSVTKRSLVILIPTIRKSGSQVIATFNRENELDPVYMEYVLKKKNKAFIAKVNFDVLEEVGLLSDVIKQEIEDDRINDPDAYAHKWLGEPLNQSDQAIISRTSILEAMQRKVEPVGQEVVGVDVARMGSDRTILWKRKGLKTTAVKEFKKQRTNVTTDRVIEFVGCDKTKKINVDDTGVGGGITDNLLVKKYNVVPINFGETAFDPDKYPNLISEAWFYFASIIDEVELPYDEELLMELSNRQFSLDKQERRCVESKKDYKKRGFPSPDKADACIICYYNKVIIEANLIYKDFSALNVIQPFAVPKIWNHYRAINLKLDGPTSCVWIAKDHQGDCYIYREYQDQNITTDEHAENICIKSIGEKYTGTLFSGLKKLITDYNRSGVRGTEFKDETISGIARIQELIKPENNRPKLFVFSNCIQTIDEFETREWEKRKDEDLNSREKPLDRNNSLTSSIENWVTVFHFQKVLTREELDELDTKERERNSEQNEDYNDVTGYVS